MSYERSAWAASNDFLDSLLSAASTLRAGWEAENRAIGQRFVAAHELMVECVNHPDCGDDSAEARRGRSVVDPQVMAGSYLVRELSISADRAEYMISFAADLHFRYPAILQAMLDGLMEERVARGLARQMSCVADDVLGPIQEEVVKDYLDSLKAGGLRGENERNARADEIIGKHDPDGIRERKADAVRARSVTFRKGQDGMSALSATLRSDEAAVLAEAIEAKVAQDRAADEAARAAAVADAEAAGEPVPELDEDPDYTMGQRKADALLSLSCGDVAETGSADSGNGARTGTRTGTGTDSGTDSGTDASAGPAATTKSKSLVLRPRITVITSAVGGNMPDYLASLSGACPESGHGQGLGSTAGVEFLRTGEAALQSLLDLLAAADGASIEPISPAIGAADDADAALRYRPRAELARRIRLRDGTCRHPGCTVSAESCDLDHCVPFNHDDPKSGGLTVESNLGALCRRHHRFKTFAGWRYEMSPDGTLVITCPDGTTMVTRPSGPLAAYRREQERDEAESWKRQQRRNRDPNHPGAAGHSSSGAQVHAQESAWMRRARRQEAKREESREASRAERERIERERREDEYWRKLADAYSAGATVRYCLREHDRVIQRRRAARVLVMKQPSWVTMHDAAPESSGSRWWDARRPHEESKQLAEKVKRFREELADPPPF
ncbi:hypothetical protein NCCP2495_09860 [Dietzia sp. NCCP-2495]|uniref:HNH endonuclease signature motif containing protein n=1 Tax=Dietzia sp. NCCP-2495 TaxID=2934675 RepID=UPI00222ECF1F|nr:HNH endonuclease signature motif containing protein [Dietzia sp. NCCP-2495]GLB63108.1 hypothetical protein NCCP2495_09860 [Dietzia sp. NCCP-2495]